MEVPFLFLVVSFWGTILFAIIPRLINSKAVRKLNIEEKGKVVEFYQEQVEDKNFKEQVIPFYGILFLLFTFSNLTPLPLILIICLALNFAWYRIIMPKRFRNLKAIGLPVSYEKSYRKNIRFHYIGHVCRMIFILCIYMVFKSSW